MILWPAVFAFLPVLFVMLVWAMVTAFRILRPEQPKQLPDEAVMRAEATRRGKPVRVGAREIRADIRLWQHRHAPPYTYDAPASGGLPEAWWEDAAHRMN